jgi:hypothetical protein
MFIDEYDLTVMENQFRCKISNAPVEWLTLLLGLREV